MPEPYIVVRVWSSRSESSYYFGPFVDEDAADSFIAGLSPDRYSEARKHCLNPPRSAHDGSAVEFE